MNNYERVRIFVYFNYVELSRKSCLEWILSILFVDLIFLVPNANVAFAIFATISSVIILVYLSFLVFSSKRKQPLNRFLSDWLAGTYIAILMNYEAYQLFFADGKPVMFVLFLLLLLGCSTCFLIFTKKKCLSQNLPEKKKNTATFAALGAIGGVSVARVLFPSLGHNFAAKVGASCLLISSLLLSAVSVQLLKAIYVCKYNLEAP